jgi:ribonuclease HI
MNVTIYTDGACKGNPGPGGFAAILSCNGHTKEVTGGETMTTNSRMELRAVIEGIKVLSKPCTIQVFSDSKYLVDAFNEDWVGNWIRRAWRASKGKVANQDLWQELLLLKDKHTVTWHWVKGHAFDPMNNKADSLASNAAEAQKGTHARATSL